MTAETVESAEETTVSETVEETIVTVNRTEVITMMYITSKVTGEKKATITMATEKRLQELMNREHQSNEAKFLAWALEEYKCECGCGGASIKEIRKYAEQEDWLRDEFCFDTEGYMEDTARAMNNRFHDYMAYWCRLCHSSLSIKSFNKLVKAVYDMTDEYGYVIYPEEVEEEPEAAETVESVEETTVSETVEETIVTVNRTEVITMMYITSKVTGEKKATITMATEKRLQELMNREHQSNEAKFLAWALEEYKCECGCGGASIKEIRKYAEQEDWLRDEFCFDTEGYMEDTARAMNNRFHDYMAYWCRLCHSSLSIKSFNKLVKAVYDMTDEYGYVIYPEEEPEAAETVESAEETDDKGGNNNE